LGVPFALRSKCRPIVSISVQPNTLVTKILELSREDPNFLQRLERFRRAITVMFTDIKGSTAYFEHFGDIAGLAMVRECNNLLRHVVESHGGRVIQVIGDSVMAGFDNCDESIRAAIEMQHRLRKANARRKKEEEMLVRIGLHHGTGIVTSNDVFGDVVNVASRVESIAGPGQILISDSLQRQISVSGFDVVFFGRFQLKGKSEDRDLFEVRCCDARPEPLSVAHAIASRAGTIAILQYLSHDGAVTAEYPFALEDLTIGRREGDITFPEDPTICAVHARFSVKQGEPFVEDLSDRGSIFIRLTATHMLQQGDIVAMGGRLFTFFMKPEIIAAATALGRTLSNVTQLLNEAAAQFVIVDAEGRKEFPVQQAEVTFGRTKGTYTFNDDPLMSSSHARVYHRGEDFFLEDLRSRNGTFVKVCGSATVPFGAMILIGRQRFRIARA
jgi:class 3 adenylate cyclase